MVSLLLSRRWVLQVRLVEVLFPGYTNLVYFSWLGWEVVHETNVGLDFRTLNSRLTLEADWYYRLTQNAVINAPLPMGAGNLLGNNGEILNTGVELSFELV